MCTDSVIPPESRGGKHGHCLGLSTAQEGTKMSCEGEENEIGTQISGACRVARIVSPGYGFTQLIAEDCVQTEMEGSSFEFLTKQEASVTKKRNS